MTTNKPTKLVVTQAQREAALEGRVHDCPYNHQIGTRCPNCASWPFKKGGAAAFIKQVRENHRLASTAEIVAWLRTQAGSIDDLDRHVDAHLFADAIERGDFKEGTLK